MTADLVNILGPTLTGENYPALRHCITGYPHGPQGAHEHLAEAGTSFLVLVFREFRVQWDWFGSVSVWDVGTGLFAASLHCV